MYNIILTLTAIVISLFLVLVLFHRRSSSQREGFTTQSEMSKEAYDEYATVIDAYVKTFLYRKPSPDEILKYMNLMSDPEDTESLSKNIKKTPEYKRYKTIMKEVDAGVFAPVTPIPTGHTQTHYASSPSLEVILESSLKDMDPSEKQIIRTGILELYSTLLKRYPGAHEFNYYTIRLSTDKNFTFAKLKNILKTSQEYVQMTNDSGIMGFERLDETPSAEQVNFEVEEIYKKATSKLDPPAEPLSAELFEFLKYKYRHFELEESRLTTLILRMYEVDLKTRMLNAEKVEDYNQHVDSEDYNQHVDSEDHSAEYFNIYMTDDNPKGFYKNFKKPDRA